MLLLILLLVLTLIGLPTTNAKTTILCDSQNSSAHLSCDGNHTIDISNIALYAVLSGDDESLADTSIPVPDAIKNQIKNLCSDQRNCTIKINDTSRGSMNNVNVEYNCEYEYAGCFLGSGDVLQDLGLINEDSFTIAMCYYQCWTYNNRQFEFFALKDENKRCYCGSHLLPQTTTLTEQKCRTTCKKNETCSNKFGTPVYQTKTATRKTKMHLERGFCEICETQARPLNISISTESDEGHCKDTIQISNISDKCRSGEAECIFSFRCQNNRLAYPRYYSVEYTCQNGSYRHALRPLNRSYDAREIVSILAIGVGVAVGMIGAILFSLFILLLRNRCFKRQLQSRKTEIQNRHLLEMISSHPGTPGYQRLHIDWDNYNDIIFEATNDYDDVFLTEQDKTTEYHDNETVTTNTNEKQISKDENYGRADYATLNPEETGFSKGVPISKANLDAADTLTNQTDEMQELANSTYMIIDPDAEK